MSLITPIDEAAAPELYWMAVAACVFGFAMSFGIGANDVGNCFATTVAAKSLTLMQVRYKLRYVDCLLYLSIYLSIYIFIM